MQGADRGFTGGIVHGADNRADRIGAGVDFLQRTVKPLDVLEDGDHGSHRIFHAGEIVGGHVLQHANLGYDLAALLACLPQQVRDGFRDTQEGPAVLAGFFRLDTRIDRHHGYLGVQCLDILRCRGYRLDELALALGGLGGFLDRLAHIDRGLGHVLGETVALGHLLAVVFRSPCRLSRGGLDFLTGAHHLGGGSGGLADRTGQFPGFLNLRPGGNTDLAYFVYRQLEWPAYLVDHVPLASGGGIELAGDIRGKGIVLGHLNGEVPLGNFLQRAVDPGDRLRGVLAGTVLAAVQGHQGGCGQQAQHGQ